MTPGALVIAHRAANSAEGIRAAVVAGADLVEADVHLFRGRLEVRHAKTLGPLPRLWEKWYLLEREAPRPPLTWILAAAGSAPGLVLDLKGPDPRLPRALRAAFDEQAAPPGTWICGRVWRTVDRLRGTGGLRTLNSVGSRTALRSLLRRYGPGSLEGVSIRRDLLTPGVVEALRTRADTLWTWPVDDPETAARLVGWGVTGLISDAPGRLRRHPDRPGV